MQTKAFREAKYGPRQIRILPMSTNNIPPVRIRDFFARELPESDGAFTFRRRVLACGPGSLVLFQYSGGIIASAILRRTVLGAIYDEDCGPCNGAYLFDPESVRLLGQPVTLEELQSVAPNVRVFGQASHTIDLELWDDIEGLLAAHV